MSTRDNDCMGGIAGFDWQAARDEANESEIKRLRAECEALRADAERYRWLRDNCVRRWRSDMPQNKGAQTLDFEFDGKGHDPDAAIDAARAARGEG